MKKLILFFFLIPILGMSQGVFIQSDTGLFNNGDSLLTDYYLKKWQVDFEGQVLRWEIAIISEYVTDENTYNKSNDLPYGMTLGDTIIIQGQEYTTPQIYGEIFDQGDLPALLIVGKALISKYPLKKFQH